MPGNQYDFILNPQKPQKRNVLGGIGGDPFISKILFIVGGAVVLMVMAALFINLLFGSKTNVETLVALAQTEQEIVRLSSMGEDAADQSIRNAAITSQLSVTSHQRIWLATLNKHNRQIEDKELSLKRDASTDKKLTTARQTSTFDTTYATVMRSKLEAYATVLKTAHQGSSDAKDRAALSSQYDDVQLLLKQWPGGQDS